MRVRRKVAWVVAVAVAAVLAAAGAVYIQAGRIPSSYRPARLSASQRDLAAKEFLNRKVLDEFGNATQLNRPFDWSITEDQCNRYLASLDEIASSAPSVEPGRVDAALAEAGLAEPAVAFADGRLTIMARSTRYRKIVSADLDVAIDADGMLVIRLREVRTGALPLPDKWLREALRQFDATLDSAADPGGTRGGLVSSLDVARVLTAAVAAIDRKPIEPVLTWPVSERKVRITALRASDGVLTLHLEPASGHARASGR
jgi:hypothetical protein